VEALVEGPETVAVIVFIYIDHFLLADDGLDRHVVVLAVPQTDHPPGFLVQDQVQGQVAEGHGDDRVDGIGVAAADEIAQLLVDNVDAPAVVELGR